MKVLLIGGDKRSEFAEKEFRKAGFETETLGLYENDNGNLSKADIIVLPVPTTRDGENVFCPLTKRVIPLESLNGVCKKTLIFSSLYGSEKENFTDICALEEFAQMNAVPTAEGAIAYAVLNTGFTLLNSKILIIGNGRIGKALRERLKAFGADITVSARKLSDFAEINACGCKYTETKKVPDLIDNYDLIFNTADTKLFKYEELCKSDITLIDLSTLGCCDSYGGRIQKLPGLPGKTAPETAGKIIANTVIGQLKLRRERN